MFAAARVMAAGKAGLESLPYFVDELLAQGITQLAPWAADHDVEEIESLNRDTRQQRHAGWRDIYGIGNASLGVKMQPNALAARDLLDLINPLAASDSLANSPAQLAAWCRRNIEQTCRATARLWNDFKKDNGVNGQQLAVVIPYCPEGPTSGTVGMYLGAALRKHFEKIRQSDELVVWGIELCPPVNTDATGALDKDAMEHAFRGYVARMELLDGVPLSARPDDEERHKPFDINIVFDGGVQSGSDARQVIWKSLDRAAAQSTACLLNGAAGADNAEAASRLKVGSKRWNVHLTHVVSETTYDQACRYLNYRVNLPWERSKEWWENRSTPLMQKKNDLQLRVNNNIRPLQAEEPDSAVKEEVGKVIQAVDALAKLRLAFIRRNQVRSILKFAQDESKGWTRRLPPSAPDKVQMRPDPFCLTVRLPEHLRRENAELLREGHHYEPIAKLLGESGISEVQGWAETLLNQVLERSDCFPSFISSAARFEEVIAISIADQMKGSENERFQPSHSFLTYFLGEGNREMPGSFNARTHDLSKYIPAKRQRSGASPKPKYLYWHVNGVEYDVPVEYSFLTLARCRPEDGFQDISTYDRLEEEYRKLIGNGGLWRQYARYYGVKPPAELLAEAPEHTASQPSRNGSAESSPVEATETNGHREFVEQEV